MALDTTIGGESTDSYVTLAAFQTYAANMGWTLTGTDAAQEAALRRGALYLDGTYTWAGVRKTREQARDWPRDEAYDSDGWHVGYEDAPQKVKDAQCEAAWLHLGGTDLSPTKIGAVTSERVKAGPVESQKTYGGAPATPRFASIDRLVADFVIGGPNQLRMLRA